MAKFRTIVHDPEVDQDIESARRLYRLVEGSVMSIEWDLAQNTQIGVHRRGRYWVYVKQGKKIHRVPEVTVLYSFSDDEVIFYAITFRPQP
jgi:hypothetical protein